jgi:hypothetical protein
VQQNPALKLDTAKTIRVRKIPARYRTDRIHRLASRSRQRIVGIALPFKENPRII